MKLDVNVLRYLTREELRTLQAVELGQKNVGIIVTRVHHLLALFWLSLEVEQLQRCEPTD